MKKAKLRNEIEKMLEAQLSRRMIAHTPLGDTDILNANIIAKHIAPDILSLLEGRLKKEPSNKDSIYYSEDNDAEFYVGWNACLEEIKEKIK